MKLYIKFLERITRVFNVILKPFVCFLCFGQEQLSARTKKHVEADGAHSWGVFHCKNYSFPILASTQESEPFFYGRSKISARFFSPKHVVKKRRDIWFLTFHVRISDRNFAIFPGKSPSPSVSLCLSPGISTVTLNSFPGAESALKSHHPSGDPEICINNYRTSGILENVRWKTLKAAPLTASLRLIAFCFGEPHNII